MGDTVASGAGVIILIEALRSGVSIPVFLHMTLNMGINFLVGLIPGAGAVASVFFKSNSRNLHLLTTWQEGQKDKVHYSTLRFYAGLLILAALIISFIIIGWAFYAWLFVNAVDAVLHALGLR